MSGVSIRQVTKHYGAVEVIHGLNVEVIEGEFLVFVGPSGCGKSTLLRMVAGLESFQSGEIAIGGRVVPSAIRRRYLNHRRIIGSTMHTRDGFAELATIAVAGGVEPVVAETYPLAEIAEAQRRFAAKDIVGKLVLEP